MFEGFPKSNFEIVSPEGHSRGSSAGIYTGSEIVVPDPQAVILAGDEMRRRLPNGCDETFEVIDPQYNQETFGIPAHFLVRVRRKGTFAHNSGGHMSITVSGANSRVNVGPTDNSKNVVGDITVFEHLRAAIADGVADEAERTQLLQKIEEMSEAQDEQSFLKSYQTFIASAADHMGLVAPFLPALAGLLV